MNVLFELYPFICALFIIEGFVLVHTGMLLFVYRKLWPHSQLLHAGIRFRGFGFGTETFYCHESPLLITARGCYFLRNRSDRPLPFSPIASYSFVPFGELDNISVVDRDLFYGSTLMARLQTSAMAQKLHHRIRALPKKQTVILEDVVSDAFSTDKIMQRIGAVQSAAQWLSILQMLFFFLLFLPIPLLYVVNPPAFPLHSYFILLAGTWIGNVVLFARATKRLYGTVDVMNTIQSILYPISCCRSVLYMSNYALIGFDPFAVAAVVLRKRAFLAYAQRSYEIIAGCCDLDLPQDLHELFVYRKKLYGEVAKHAGCEVAELTAVPPESDATARCYCPVCRSEFRIAIERCAVCNVKTRQFRNLQSSPHITHGK